MISSKTVVSISFRRVMLNRSYGRVRKKSNHTAADKAASRPASRSPFAATMRMRASASGTAGPARMATRSRLSHRRT
jgi:hypothetical protein